MRVVGEAILLLFRIVQDESELHALARKLAIRHAAEAGENRRKTAIRALARDSSIRALPPGAQSAVISVQIGDQKLGRRPQIRGAAIAIAVRAGGRAVVGRRTLAGAGTGAVQVLAPEQEFDRVIAGGDIGFDALRHLNLAQQIRVDDGRVHLARADADLPVGDDVQRVERILVRRRAVGRAT